MSSINALLRVVFDALMMPFRGIGPWWALLLISVLSAVISLFVFKWTSNPEKVEASKRGMQAALFEIRLFNDDFLAILRATADMMLCNMKYIYALLLLPTIVMMVPFTMAYFHLDPFYSFEGLEPGQSAILRVEVDESSAAERPDIQLETPQGISVETPAVWVPSEREMSWRIRADEAGEYDLTVHHRGVASTKTAVVSDALVRKSNERPDTRLFAQLENPSESPLEAASGLQAIELNYPETDDMLFGFLPTWLLVWIGLMILFAVLMKDLVGVTL